MIHLGAGSVCAVSVYYAVFSILIGDSGYAQADGQATNYFCSRCRVGGFSWIDCCTPHRSIKTDLFIATQCILQEQNLVRAPVTDILLPPVWFHMMELDSTAIKAEDREPLLAGWSDVLFVLVHCAA